MHQLRMSSLRPFSRWTKIPSSLPDFFFFSTSSLPQNFPCPTYHLPPPVLPTTYLPPPTYHLPTPPPLTPSPQLQRPRAAVERELELWLWSWSGWSWSGVAGVGAGPTRTRKGKRSSSFSCLFACCNATSSGACVAFLQRSKLRSQAPELACLLRLACCCNAALLAAATQQAPERESLLLQHSKLRSLLQLNPATQQALERLLQ
jgi:hypothetical protein